MVLALQSFGCQMELQITQVFVNLLLQRGCPTLKKAFAGLTVLQSWQQAPNSTLICEYSGFLKELVEVPFSE